MPTREDHHQSEPGNWVQKLHTRSWEMELLIVGFALLVLLEVPDYLNTQINFWASQSSSQLVKSIIPLAFMLVIGTNIMKFNLIIHLLLRGYWIGIIGLNSVYPKGIDFERLTFAPKFKDFLTRKVQNLEEAALSIDRICSGIFAFTFLLIFMFISIGLFFVGYAMILLLLFLVTFWLPIENESSFLAGAMLLISVPYLIAGVLMAINFLSLGGLKKIKIRWFSTLFFYISRFFRLVTFSFLYESIYYTLISNVSKRMIGVILLSYVIAISAYLMVNYNEDIFNPKKSANSALKISAEYYENKHKDITVVKVPTIQSDVIRDKHIALFIPYDVEDTDSLLSKYPEIKPFRKRGFSQSFSLTFGTSDTSNITFGPGAKNSAGDIEKTLSCLSDFYIVTINDSVYNDLKFFFYEHPNRQEPGIFAYISTEKLKNGNNLLTIRKNLKYRTEKVHRRNTHYIPFWLE